MADESTPTPKPRTPRKAAVKKAPARRPAAKRAPAKPGRKSLLTEERITQIAELVAMGMGVERAAALAGVSKTAFHNWARAGREELERLADAGDPEGEPAPDKRLNVELVNALQKAQSAFILQRISRIKTAGENGSWQADAWLLERLFTSEFGRQVREPQRTEDTAGALVRALSALVGTERLPGE